MVRLLPGAGCLTAVIHLQTRARLARMTTWLPHVVSCVRRLVHLQIRVRSALMTTWLPHVVPCGRSLGWADCLLVAVRPCPNLASRQTVDRCVERLRGSCVPPGRLAAFWAAHRRRYQLPPRSSCLLAVLSRPQLQLGKGSCCGAWRRLLAASSCWPPARCEAATAKRMLAARRARTRCATHRTGRALRRRRRQIACACPRRRTGRGAAACARAAMLIAQKLGLGRSEGRRVNDQLNNPLQK